MTAPETVITTAVVEEQLARLFRSFKQFWHRAATELHPQLQPLGYGLLVVLAKAGPQSMGALAERLAVEKTVLSRQVRQLVELDLAEVDTDPHDGRVRILRARPGVLDRVVEQRNRAITPAGAELSRWDVEDLTTFSVLVDRLLSAVDQSG